MMIGNNIEKFLGDRDFSLGNNQTPLDMGKSFVEDNNRVMQTPINLNSSKDNFFNQELKLDTSYLNNLGEEFGKIKYLSNERNLEIPTIDKSSIDENLPYSSFANIGNMLKEKLDLSKVWDEVQVLGEEVARYKWAYDQGKFGNFDGKKFVKELGKSTVRSALVNNMDMVGNVFKMLGHNLKDGNIIVPAFNITSVVNGAGDVFLELGNTMNEFATNVNNLPIFLPDVEVYDENPNWMNLANLVGQSASQVLAMSALSRSIGSGATYGLFATAGSADIFNEAVDNDGDVDKANLLAFSNASLTYAIDKMFNPIPKQLDRGVKYTAKLVAKEMVGAPLREVGAEVLQQIGAENLVRKIGIDNTQKLFEGVIESAIGAMAGSFVVAGGDGSIYYAKKRYDDLVSKLKTDYNIEKDVFDLFESDVINFAIKSPEAFNKIFEKNLRNNINTFVKSIDDNKKKKVAKKDLAQLSDVYSKMKEQFLETTGDENVSNLAAKLFESNALFLYGLNQNFTPSTLIDMYLPKIKKSDRDEAIKLLSSPQRAIAFQFGGVKAKNIDINNLMTAIDMEKHKVDPQVIWKRTGWHRGSDGKMRFEIDDENAKLKLWNDVDIEKDVNIYKNELIHDLELLAVQFAYFLRPYHKKNYEAFYNDFYKFLDDNKNELVQFDGNKLIDLGSSQGEDFSLVDDMIQKRRDFEELYMAELWDKYQRAISPDAKDIDKDAVFLGEDAKTIEALIEEKNFALFYRLYWSRGQNGLKKAIEEVDKIDFDDEKYHAYEQRLIDIALKYQKEREKRAESIKKYGLDDPYYLYHDIRSKESFDIYMAGRGDFREDRGQRGFRSSRYLDAYKPVTLGEKFLNQPQYDFMDEIHKIDLIKYLDQVEKYYRLERYLKFVKEENAKSIRIHNYDYLNDLKHDIDNPVLIYKAKRKENNLWGYNNFEKDEIASYEGRLLIQNGNTMLLKDTLEHPELFERYPNLEETVIQFTRLKENEPYHFYVDDNNKYVFQIDAEQVDFGSFTDLLLKGTNFAIEHEEGFDYSLTDKQRSNFMDRQIYMAKKKMEVPTLKDLSKFVEDVFDHSDYKKYWKETEMPVSLLNIYKGIDKDSVDNEIETIKFGEIDFDLLLDDINQKYSNIENEHDNYIRRAMLWQLQALKTGYMRRILAEARMNTGLIDVGMPWSGYFTQGKLSELALVKHREHSNYLSRHPYFSDSKGYVQILPDDGVSLLDSISYDDDTEMKFKKDENYLRQVWADVANGAYDFSNNIIHLFENADVETIIHESFHYFNSFLKNPEFNNNFVLEGDYYGTLDNIKEDISLKYKVYKSDNRYYVVSRDTEEIMKEVQRGFSSASEALDAAAEEVFIDRLVKLFMGKRTIGTNIAKAGNLYRTWLNKVIAGMGITAKTSGEGGKNVLKFLRNKLK